MRRRTSEDLARIFQELAGSVVWVPLSNGERPPEVGPLPLVYIRWSDLSQEDDGLEERYWSALRKVPRQGALGIFAFINNLLVLGGSATQVHRVLNDRFLPKGLREKAAEFTLERMPSPARQALPLVFNRLGCLMVMWHLILYGVDSEINVDAGVGDVGELALLANEFIQRDTLPSSPGNNSIDVPLQFVPIWDIYNPPDLAYALPRMVTTLTEIFPGGDREVVTLSSKLGLDPASVTCDGIRLVDLISVVFGLYAFGRKLPKVGKDAVVFDNKRIFEKAQTLLPGLNKFLRRRSLSLATFRRRFGTGGTTPQKTFLKEIRARSFLASGLNSIRQFPLLKLEGDRTAILDLQFLVDLGTSGVYWSIFDALPRGRREVFQQLWGRLLELYATGLLQEFYPPLSGLLRSDVTYKGGQIDALLDFPNAVIVFEIKSSLLSEKAKRLGNRSEFERQVKLKFVRNEKGHSKAVLQLAKSAKAIVDGLVPTANKSARVYPVLVGEEAALQTLGFNTYLNAIFQENVARDSLVRPMTVMTMGELEEILPYVSDNAFTWAELFETRFAGSDVIGNSVYQAIFDWRQRRRLPAIRNGVIFGRLRQLFRKMKESYGFQQ